MGGISDFGLAERGSRSSPVVISNQLPIKPLGKFGV